MCFGLAAKYFENLYKTVGTSYYSSPNPPQFPIITYPFKKSGMSAEDRENIFGCIARLIPHRARNHVIKEIFGSEHFIYSNILGKGEEGERFDLVPFVDTVNGVLMSDAFEECFGNISPIDKTLKAGFDVGKIRNALEHIKEVSPSWGKIVSNLVEVHAAIALVEEELLEERLKLFGIKTEEAGYLLNTLYSLTLQHDVSPWKKNK